MTATLDTDCTPAVAGDEDEDPVADDDSGDDAEIDFFQDEEDEDLGDDESCSDDDELEKGTVLQSAELEDGFLLDYVIA